MLDISIWSSCVKTRIVHFYAFLLLLLAKRSFKNLNSISAAMMGKEISPLLGNA